MKITYHYNKQISRNEIVLLTHPKNKNLCDHIKIKLLEMFQLIYVYDEQNNKSVSYTHLTLPTKA